MMEENGEDRTLKFHNRASGYSIILEKNRNISLLINKINIELNKKLVRCYVWSIVFGSETWTLRKLKQKYLESFEMWCWKRMKKINWSEKVKNILGAKGGS